MISPDQAYFGLKDCQQYRVIEQLIADLDFAIKLNGLPTAREDSAWRQLQEQTYIRAAPVGSSAVDSYNKLPN